MRGRGKWAKLENYIFIMTLGKLHSFCLSFSFVNEKKEFNKCNSFLALAKFGQTPVQPRNMVCTHLHSFNLVQHNASGIYLWVYFH